MKRSKLPALALALLPGLTLLAGWQAKTSYDPSRDMLRVVYTNGEGFDFVPVA